MITSDIAKANFLALVGSLLAFLSKGCVPEFSDDTSRVTEAKVIAVRSVPAEPAPGETVRLSALLVSASPEGTDETLEWYSCLTRRSANDAGPVAETCLEVSDDSVESSELIGTGSEVDFEVEPTACRMFGPLPPPADGEGVGRPASPDQSGGYYQPVVVQGSDSALVVEPVLATVRLFCGGAGLGQEELIAFNRGYRPNQNPELERVDLTVGGESVTAEGDGTFAVPASAKVTLRVTWQTCPTSASCGDGMCTAGENPTECAADCRTQPVVGCAGAETYLLADPETRKTIEALEEMNASWFATQGTFEVSVTDNRDEVTSTSNTWTAPEEPGPVDLWIVVRDSRRGTTWQHLHLDVVSP